VKCLIIVMPRLIVFTVAAMLVVATSSFAGSEPQSHAAQITLIARLAAHAELSSNGTSASEVTVQKSGADSLVITAPGDTRVDIPFTVVMNTRSGRLRCIVVRAADVVVDVRPSTAECDWIHAPLQLHQTRVVGLLSGCRPSQPQAGFISVNTGAYPVTMTVIVDPIVN
jgi:hypothetical protein